MFKQLLLIGLLGISLVALLGSEAIGAVCVMKVGQTCMLWTKTITCDIAASGLGNCAANDWTIGCTVEGKGDWVVACGNPGSNTWTSPGIQLAQFHGTVSGEVPVTSTDCLTNGNASVSVEVPVPGDMLYQIGQIACPNPNWTAVDAVPCVADALVEQFDAKGCVVANATLHCELPNCSTLGWDLQAQTFQERQYNCTRTSYKKNMVPVCPQP